MVSKPRENQACCNTRTKEVDAGGCCEPKISRVYIKMLSQKQKRRNLGNMKFSHLCSKAQDCVDHLLENW